LRGNGRETRLVLDQVVGRQNQHRLIAFAGTLRP